MERLAAFQEALSRYSRVGLDTNVVIYFLEGVPGYFPYVDSLMGQIEGGKLSTVLSAVVELELLVKPLREKRAEALQDIALFLDEFPHLEVVSLNRDTARLAARIRAQTQISTPDAIIVATSINSGCQAVVGNDKQCAIRVKDIPYVYLEGFVKKEAGK